jgi:hypothetical protein
MWADRGTTLAHQTDDRMAEKSMKRNLQRMDQPRALPGRDFCVTLLRTVRSSLATEDRWGSGRAAAPAVPSGPRYNQGVVVWRAAWASSEVQPAILMWPKPTTASTEIKPKDNHSLLNQGTLTFELNQGFELNDAETLAKMLKDWITQIHFEPID